MPELLWKMAVGRTKRLTSRHDGVDTLYMARELLEICCLQNLGAYMLGKRGVPEHFRHCEIRVCADLDTCGAEVSSRLAVRGWGPEVR